MQLRSSVEGRALATAAFEDELPGAGQGGRGRGRGGRGRGRGRGGGRGARRLGSPSPKSRIAPSNRWYACGFPGCGKRDLKNLTGLKRHVTVIHSTKASAAKRPWIVVTEAEAASLEGFGPAAARARRAASAAVGEASFGEEDDALDANPSGLGEDESDAATTARSRCGAPRTPRLSTRRATRPRTTSVLLGDLRRATRATTTTARAGAGLRRRARRERRAAASLRRLRGPGSGESRLDWRRVRRAARGRRVRADLPVRRAATTCSSGPLEHHGAWRRFATTCSWMAEGITDHDMRREQRIEWSRWRRRRAPQSRVLQGVDREPDADERAAPPTGGAPSRPRHPRGDPDGGAETQRDRFLTPATARRGPRAATATSASCGLRPHVRDAHREHVEERDEVQDDRHVEQDEERLLERRAGMSRSRARSRTPRPDEQRHPRRAPARVHRCPARGGGRGR